MLTPPVAEVELPDDVVGTSASTFEWVLGPSGGCPGVTPPDPPPVEEEIRGLVEDAQGKGYSVTVGMRIGRSGGVVSRITGKEILVREEFVGNRGEKIVRESGIQLTTAGGI